MDWLASHPALATALQLVGVAVVGSYAYSVLKLLAQLTVIPGKSLKSYGARTGAWAVVTGPTGDIGLAFAEQLARAGFNIVLVGRNQSKLSSVGSDLKSRFKVETKEVVVDFAKPEKSSFEEVAQLAKQIEISVLINNAGLSHEMPVDFAETDPDEMLAILDVNVKSTLLITQAVLPGMLSRKRGLVLNIGTFSARVPSAMLATYTGSKAFLEKWSQALGEEVASRGVDVRLVVPYFVVSQMSKIRKPSLMTPTSQAFVRSTLSSLLLARGARDRAYTSTPYWSHALLDWAIGTFRLERFAMGQALGMHKSIRKRALAKKERLAKQQ